MRIVTSFAWLAGGCLLLLADGAAAQAQVEKQIGFDLFAGQIESTAAEQSGVGTSAIGIQANGSVTAFRVLKASLDLGAFGMSDEQQFRQGTTHGEKSSSVSAGMATLALGLHTPPVMIAGETPVRLTAGVNVGRSFIDVNRVISDCVDCHGEDVDFDGGAFWEPALNLSMGRGGLSARYRVYGASSNLRNVVMVGYTWLPRPSGRSNAPEAPGQ